MSNIEAQENTPLIAVVEEKTPVFYSKSFIATLFVGAFLALGAVAFVTYEKPVTAMPASTMLSTMSVFDEKDGVASYCPNYYVMGLTPRTAEPGCVLLSSQDVFDENLAPKLAAYTVTVCLNGPGSLGLDKDTLEAMGFQRSNGNLHLSAAGVGHLTSVILYSGGSFDGDEKELDSSSSFAKVKYPGSDADANDNVGSIRIISKNRGDVYAGRTCGQTFSVCPAVVPSEDARGEIADGCVLVAKDDPLSPTYYKSEVKAVRFCAANDAGTVTVTEKQLQALELVRSWGDYHSTISYLNKGAAIRTIFYEGSDANTRVAGIQEGSGSLVHMYYRNKHSCNDNVNSIDINGGDPKIPVGCRF